MLCRGSFVMGLSAAGCPLRAVVSCIKEWEGKVRSAKRACTDRAGRRKVASWFYFAVTYSFYNMRKLEVVYIYDEVTAVGGCCLAF